MINDFLVISNRGILDVCGNGERIKFSAGINASKKLSSKTCAVYLPFHPLNL